MSKLTIELCKHLLHQRQQVNIAVIVGVLVFSLGRRTAAEGGRNWGFGDFVNSILVRFFFQIPLQYDAIKRDVTNHQNKENGKENNISAGDQKVVTNARKEQLRRRYLKKSTDFVQICEETFIAIDDEIRQKATNIVAVHFLFGATPVTPKETYSLVLPTRLSTAVTEKTVRPGLQLFR